MKKYSWLLIMLFMFSLADYAQTIHHIIANRTVVLRYKQHTDTLILPVVSSKYPELEKGLSFKNISGSDDNLSTTIKYYHSCGCGITSSNYEVKFENKDIISLKFDFETLGAYPDTYSTWRTLNIHTGKAYSIKNEINPQGLKWIYNSYRDTLRKRILKDKQAKGAEEDTNEYTTLKEAIDSLKFDELLENYIFTKEGVVFTMDQILPHVVRFDDPDRDLLFPYDKLKKYKLSGAIILK